MLWRLSESQREEISEHVKDADVFYKIRHFRKAMAEYEVVLGKLRKMDAPKPCIAETLVFIAEAQINNSEHDAAAQTLRKAIELSAEF